MTTFDFDATNATHHEQMERYMLNQFPFLGLQTPERKRQLKPFLRASKSWSVPDVLATVATIYARPEREYQYAAIELARQHVRQYTLADLMVLRGHILDRPWWDSVDSWRPLYGDYVALHPDQLAAVNAMFAGHPDFWMRRVAINLQLMAKGNTDTRLLATVLTADLATDEFFVQKAIGWSLREYSKTNPEWVASFIAAHPGLSKLAVREGSKKLLQK